MIIIWSISLFITLYSNSLSAQTDTTQTNLQPNQLNISDANIRVTSTSEGDTIIITNTQQNGQQKKNAINSKVLYSSTDSISLDLENQKIFMYKDADVKYEKINLKAAFIEYDFTTGILTALPLTDSAGNQYGFPDFKEGDQSFKAKEMRYSFKSKQGFIRNVITEEGGGYLHGDVVKKMQNDVSNMKGGGYTTCDLEHPHYSLRFTRAKVIPNNKIVTGPAYMTIEDVPIPLILPFGMFPNKRGQTSGIIIPTYGESRERGFYLENGGYYFGINDYMELRLVGDIYSRGSWAIKPIYNYRKRYKFNGTFNFNYAINTSGVEETESYTKKRDFRLTWTHRQDPKARPKSQFNASVNFGSSTFNRYNPVSIADHLTNTFGSSVSYSTTFGERVSFTSALRHSQNTTNRTVNITAPDIALSVNRFYPLRKPGKVSNLKWYDNISVNYSLNARNEVYTYDSLLFTNQMMKSFRNGAQHRVPVSLALKVLRYFTLTNSIEYSERWYSASINKIWLNDTLISNNDTIVGYVRTDTITGFKTAREYGFNSTLSTNLYGLVQFRKGPIRAVRHVLRPSVAFSYRPDFGSSAYGYYRTVQSDTAGNVRRYSIFGGDGTFNSIYGYPPEGRSGRLNFSLNNNLEMKVRSKRDTISGTRKIALIESLTLSSSYDLAKDSLNWSPLTLNARTTLFKRLQIQYSALYDPYIKTDKRVTLNQYEWDVNGRLFRRENSSWNFSLAYSLTPKNKTIPAKTTTSVTSSEEAQEIINQPEEYINWNNPWSFSFTYNLRYNEQLLYPQRTMDQKIVQTLGFNGEVNITPKWKVNFTSGYDFESNKLSYTSMSVYRDLHCWEMRFNWIPIGYLRSWNFYIKVKADILQDLKLNRKKDFRDN